MAGIPPPGSPPVTMWLSTIEPGLGSDFSSRLARYWANDGVDRRGSARPDLSPKITRSVSPGATGTDREPIRDNTKCVCPATNGPAPKEVRTLFGWGVPVLG